MSVVGAEGLPALQNAGNVLRPFTTLKISMRLPPTLNAVEKKEDFERILTENPPYGAKVSVSNTNFASGWNAPEN